MLKSALVAGALLAVGFFVVSRRPTRAGGPPRGLGPGGAPALYAADPRPISAGRAPDYAFIDEYLARWDRFAEGANELAPSLNTDVARFNAELAHAVRVDPAHAAGRAVMYPVLQVGGFVPADSALGRALAALTRGQGLAPVPTPDGPAYFAGDLHRWWEAHRAGYAPYPLYDEWRQRPFAREVALPMYARMYERARAGDPAARGNVRRAGEPDYFKVPTGDAAMGAAVSAARETVGAFAARVSALAPGQSYAAVKVPLREGDVVEHVWVSDLTFDGRTFHGRLGNAPVDVRGWALGDTVRVARDSVSDWMLVVHDAVYGAYTVHALRAGMSAEERAAFDAGQRLRLPSGPMPAP